MPNPPRGGDGKPRVSSRRPGCRDAFRSDSDLFISGTGPSGALQGTAMSGSRDTSIQDGRPSFPNGKGLVPISAHVLSPSTVGAFSVYLVQDDKPVLYATKGESFTPRHRQRLAELDVNQLYIVPSERKAYVNFVRDNLTTLLDDESIPCSERARFFCEATTALARDAFDRSLPNPGGVVRFRRIQTLIRDGSNFFTGPEGVREIFRLVSENEDLYAHGVGCMVLSASLLSRFAPDDRELLTACSMGALMHDVGKLELPEHILNAAPDALEHHDMEQLHSHPALGVSVCSILPLPQESLHCILFHHELEDGSGYPTRASGDMIPFYARIVSLCNFYEGLIRERPWRRALSPREALCRIRDHGGKFDRTMVELLEGVVTRSGMV